MTGQADTRPPSLLDGTREPRTGRRQALRYCRLSPAGIVVLAATGLALAIRLYLLTRLRYLTGITEYDDGVYLGGAIDLISGVLPYHDFAFVQPPGILLLMAPAALVAKAASVTTAMAVARLLTAGASAACVALVGVLVRHRGRFVTLVACTALALYPDDIITAHTLLLEPWLNLLALAGACLAFSHGQLAAPRRLLWAGVLFGLAGAVKYWAAIPALTLLVTCLVARPAPEARGPRFRRPVRFGAGVVAGFVVPVAPFALAGPRAFVNSTLFDQAFRAGSAVPESLRLAHLTGLAEVLNAAGRLTVSAGADSLFARGDVTAAATRATGWLPLLLAAALAVALVLGYVTGPARAGGAAPGPVEWSALGALAGTVTAVLAYSAFFYHYADFPAPWLAIAAGYAAGTLRGAWARRPRARSAARRPGRRAACAPVFVTAAFALLASFQAWELSGLHASDVRAEATLIPRGACVVTDEISLAIAANRFTAGDDGCPVVLDSLAATLVAGNGTSVQGGAGKLPQVATFWEGAFARARYVWLSSSSDRRIPWTPGLTRWFNRRFRPLHPAAGFEYGRLYVRR